MNVSFLNQGTLSMKEEYDTLFIGIDVCSMPELLGVEKASDRIRQLSQRYANINPPASPLKIYNPSEGYILGKTRVGDYGTIKSELKELEIRINQVPISKAVPIFVGGDHAVTYPILKSMKRKNCNLTVIHLDAHGDYLDEYKEVPHGSVMHEANKLSYVNQIIHVGLRGNLNTGPGLEKSINQGNSIFTVNSLRCRNNFAATLISTIRNEKLYLTIDIDFFDPSIAPATNNPEHGGMLYYETLDILKVLCDRFEVVGADIVEFNPLLDTADTTGLLVTNLIIELMSYICNA